MEYKISNRLKIGAVILIVLGSLGVGYGFIDSHQYTEDNITEFLAGEDGHSEGVEDGHDESAVDAQGGHGSAPGESSAYADDGVDESHGTEADVHKMSH